MGKIINIHPTAEKSKLVNEFTTSLQTLELTIQLFKGEISSKIITTIISQVHNLRNLVNPYTSEDMHYRREIININEDLPNSLQTLGSITQLFQEEIPPETVIFLTSQIKALICSIHQHIHQQDTIKQNLKLQA